MLATGDTDIYLIDQIQRGRIRPNMRLLDAGCGTGRNAEYFVRNNYDFFGIDAREEAIQEARRRIQGWNPHFDIGKFRVADVARIPFPDDHFDFIISSAVLHFAADRAQFTVLMEEMLRVLAPGGTLWIRMTAKHTIEHLAQHLHDDVYRLPDGSTRYLLDRDYLSEWMEKHGLSFADPFKTVNVSDVRTMAVVVLRV
ncbi:MAG TPA: class I SAM-dependent methyltransferase [Flavilitoribacter sp.]|nr:class I SAM-dependent methyltransferase [Flavilitoribacter sp.]HMQ89405.1 class I SAM-dependent methyltransferase [Flavilitoribacter sp.]